VIVTIYTASVMIQQGWRIEWLLWKLIAVLQVVNKLLYIKVFESDGAKERNVHNNRNENKPRNG